MARILPNRRHRRFQHEAPTTEKATAAGRIVGIGAASRITETVIECFMLNCARILRHMHVVEIFDREGNRCRSVVVNCQADPEHAWEQTAICVQMLTQTEDNRWRARQSWLIKA